ncbi:MAG: sulfotransferase family 2 domain-containing protein, partial [Vulcanimicrobiaceae bacterium]
MPIEHRRRFIFVHIPKTAGISVMLALQRMRVKLELNRRNVFPRLLEHPHRVAILRRLRDYSALATMTNYVERHLPAVILREFVADDVWRSYFKFAFVRNPWDLCVSTYHYVRRTFETSPAAVAADPDFAYVIARSDFAGYLRALPLFARHGDMSSYLV